MRIETCIICGQKYLSNHSLAKYCLNPDCKRKGLRACWRKYNAKNKRRRRAYGRNYYKLVKQKRLIQIKLWRISPNGKKSIRSSYNKQRTSHPKKYIARMEVGKAIKRGDIIRLPCQICGNKKSEAHHEDYNKPLEVIWLCNEHHNQAHPKHSEKEIEDAQDIKQEMKKRQP